MTVVKKKTHPKYFDLLAKGKKKFEFRIADFDLKEGDMLVLEEWNPETKKHTGRSLIKKVGYVKKFTLEDIQKKNDEIAQILEDEDTGGGIQLIGKVQASYENPFEEETSYKNPFDEYENPFEE